MAGPIGMFSRRRTMLGVSGPGIATGRGVGRLRMPRVHPLRLSTRGAARSRVAPGMNRRLSGPGDRRMCGVPVVTAGSRTPRRCRAMACVRVTRGRSGAISIVRI
jgi:hypothetical protein